MKSTFSETILKTLSEKTETLENIQNVLKPFFEAGVTPDFIQNPKEADILKGIYMTYYFR